MTDVFWAKVDRSGGPSACWPWTGFLNRKGYGRCGYRYRTWLAHRLAWHLTNGPVAADLAVCHSCDNPRCANPAHLWLGTLADNNRDMEVKGRARNRGERHAQARLSDAQVADIAAQVKSGARVTDVARAFGVSCPHVSMIASGKARKTSKRAA